MRKPALSHTVPAAATPGPRHPPAHPPCRHRPPTLATRSPLSAAPRTPAASCAALGRPHTPSLPSSYVSFYALSAPPGHTTSRAALSQAARRGVALHVTARSPPPGAAHPRPQNFLGGPDEEWFRLIHVEIEARAGGALAGLRRMQAAAARVRLTGAKPLLRLPSPSAP